MVRNTAAGNIDSAMFNFAAFILGGMILKDRQFPQYCCKNRFKYEKKRTLTLYDSYFNCFMKDYPRFFICR